VTVDEVIERLTEFKRLYGCDCEIIARDSHYGNNFDIHDIRVKKARNSRNQCLAEIKETNNAIA